MTARRQGLAAWQEGRGTVTLLSLIPASPDPLLENYRDPGLDVRGAILRLLPPLPDDTELSQGEIRAVLRALIDERTRQVARIESKPYRRRNRDEPLTELKGAHEHLGSHGSWMPSLRGTKASGHARSCRCPRCWQGDGDNR